MTNVENLLRAPRILFGLMDGQRSPEPQYRYRLYRTNAPPQTDLPATIRIVSSVTEGNQSFDLVMVNAPDYLPQFREWENGTLTSIIEPATLKDVDLLLGLMTTPSKFTSPVYSKPEKEFPIGSKCVGYDAAIVTITSAPFHDHDGWRQMANTDQNELVSYFVTDLQLIGEPYQPPVGPKYVRCSMCGGEGCGACAGRGRYEEGGP